MLNHSRGRHLVTALIATGAVGAAGATVPAAANAAVLGTMVSAVGTSATTAVGAVGQTTEQLTNGTSCQEGFVETTPFSPWGDANDYRLAPGGNFPATGSGWALAGGASTGASSNPHQLSGAEGAGALMLPAGSSATSPYTCVDSSQPTIRFMDAGDPGARLSVSAVFEESIGVTVTLPLAVLSPGSGWQPSAALVDGQAVPGLLNGGAVPMALTFQASGGSVEVSDAFVDPRMRN